MDLIVQGIVPSIQLNRLRRSAKARKLPTEARATFNQTLHPDAGVGMLIVIEGGNSMQQQQVFAWWQRAIAAAGYKTGCA